MTATELKNDLLRVRDEESQTLRSASTGGLRLADLPRREALNCTPEELVETSWEWS
jgi:hypothetical protein